MPKSQDTAPHDKTPRRRKPGRAVDAGAREPRSFATRDALPTDAKGRLLAADGSPLDAKRANHALELEETPDQLAAKDETAKDRQEALIDEGVEETFPASDPVSVKRIT